MTIMSWPRTWQFKNLSWIYLDLIISNGKIAGLAAKTFWMPNSIHATQKSSVANLSFAASTDPAQYF